MSFFLLELVSSAASAECSGGIQETQRHPPAVTKTWRGLHCFINKPQECPLPWGTSTKVPHNWYPEKSHLRLPPAEPAVSQLCVVNAGDWASPALPQPCSVHRTEEQPAVATPMYLSVWKIPNQFYSGSIFQAEIRSLCEVKAGKRIHTGCIPMMDKKK